jgi:hypothetical protein
LLHVEAEVGMMRKSSVMRTWKWTLGSLVMAAMSPSIAAAAEPEVPEVRADATTGAGLRLGAGLGLAWRFGDRCSREGDMVSCTSGPLIGTLQLDTRYRTGQLSFGVLAAGGRGLSGEAVSSDGSGPVPTVARWMWRTSGEARWHPRLLRGTDLWIGVELGLGGEIVSRSDVADDASDLALAAGVGLGAALTLTRSLAFTIETRLLFSDLRTDPAAEPQSPVWLGLSTGLAFGS